MKIMIFTILAPFAVIALINAMVILEEDAIYREESKKNDERRNHHKA